VLQERRYQIFLSSTYDDLREERQAVTQSILALGHLAAGMELFPASDLAQLDLIKRVIRRK
jgi:predicted transport protein